MTTKPSDWFVKPLIVTLVGGLLVGIPVAIFQVKLESKPAHYRVADTGPAAPDSGAYVANKPEKVAISTSSALPTIEKFWYTTTIMWGPFGMGMPRNVVEAETGPLQCQTGDYNGYYCSCSGVYKGIAVGFEFGDDQDDADVCMRTDSPVIMMYVHLTPTEHGASRETMTGILRSQLPQFRYLTSPEKSASFESEDPNPFYTLADGTYRLGIDYENGSIAIGYFNAWE